MISLLMLRLRIKKIYPIISASQSHAPMMEMDFWPSKHVMAWQTFAAGSGMRLKLSHAIFDFGWAIVGTQGGKR